jgi:hypothetical protein
MPKQSLDASSDFSSPHRSVSIAKHLYNGSLDHAIAETPLRWLQLRFRRPGLDSTRRQVQNGLKPWGQVRELSYQAHQIACNTG